MSLFLGPLGPLGEDKVKDFYQVVIVGGGIGGLTAAIYGARAGLDVAVFDSGVLGGELRNIHLIENYPGFVSITGDELAEKLISQAKESGAHLFSNKSVIKVEKLDDGFSVKLSGKEVKTDFVIIATGAARKKLDVPGEEELKGKGVSYCAVCDGPFFKGKRVAVVGGGSTAFTEADYLAEIASEVHIIHRRDKFRAYDYLVKRVTSKPNVKLHLFKVVDKILGDNKVEKVILKDRKTGELSELELDALFISIGSEPRTKMLDPELYDKDEKGFIITDEYMMTKTRGLYAVGDIRSKYLRQLVTAAADGAIAATHISENR